MKKQAFGIFTMLSLLLVLGVASVNAQSPRTLNIPFSFNVGHKMLPAGEYLVEPNRTDSQNVWLLKTKEGSTSVVFPTVSAQDNQTQERIKLVFHKYDNQYFLSQVWVVGTATGNELPKSKMEKRLEDGGSQSEKHSVVAFLKHK